MICWWWKTCEVFFLQLVKYDVWIHHDFLWDNSWVEDQCGQSSVFSSFFRWSTEVDHWTTHESKKLAARNETTSFGWCDGKIWFFHNFQVDVECLNREWSSKLDGLFKQNIPFLDPKKVLECNETRLFPRKKAVTQGNGNWTHNRPKVSTGCKTGMPMKSWKVRIWRNTTVDKCQVIGKQVRDKWKQAGKNMLDKKRNNADGKQTVKQVETHFKTNW